VKDYKIFYHLQEKLGKSYDEMMNIVKEHIKPGGYNHDGMKKLLGVDDLIDMISDIPHAYEVLKNNVKFYPFERAFHVFSEAKRVADYQDVCSETFEGSADEDTRGEKLGKLMNDSQSSCKILYECSSEHLDELITLCR
jgi:N-acetylgalactosamine kinase